jgi:ABC-type phosphate transport system, permease component
MITSFKSFFIEQYVLSDFIALGSYTETELSLLFTQIENTALGIKLFDENTILIDGAVNKLNYINKTIENLTYVTVLGLSGLLVLYSLFNINNKLNSRKIVEKFLLVLYFTCSLVAIMTTVGIIFSLLYETLRFFSQVPIADFLFGLNWSPQRVFVREAGDLDTRDFGQCIWRCSIICWNIFLLH